MAAAVPGSIIAAPISFLLVGAGGAALGFSSAAPVGIAVITSYLVVSFVRAYREQQDAM